MSAPIGHATCAFLELKCLEYVQIHWLVFPHKEVNYRFASRNNVYSQYFASCIYISCADRETWWLATDMLLCAKTDVTAIISTSLRSGVSSDDYKCIFIITMDFILYYSIKLALRVLISEFTSMGHLKIRMLVNFGFSEWKYEVHVLAKNLKWSSKKVSFDPGFDVAFMLVWL